MPRNVRNFWLELDVDGARTRIETGPRSKDGGFSLVIQQRDSGAIVRTGSLTGHAMADGRLHLVFTDAGSGESVTVETRR